MNKEKLRQIIREEINKELHETAKGAAIGYLVGALVDFFKNRKKKSGVSTEPEKSEEEIRAVIKRDLDKRYETDSEFRKIVDDLIAGKDINVPNL